MADEKKTEKIELNDKEIDEAAGGVIVKEDMPDMRSRGRKRERSIL